MNDNKLDIISTKLSILIALSLRQLTGDADFAGKTKRKQGVGDLARFLDNMGIESKDIAEILGAPISSVRTLLTPARRK
jgi:hypothetical protein